MFKAWKVLGIGERLCRKELPNLGHQSGPKRCSYSTALDRWSNGTLHFQQSSGWGVLHYLCMLASCRHCGVNEASVHFAAADSLLGFPPVQLHCGCDPCQQGRRSKEKARTPKTLCPHSTTSDLLHHCFAWTHLKFSSVMRSFFTIWYLDIFGMYQLTFDVHWPSNT